MKKEKLAEEIKQIKERYSNQVAAPMIEEKRAAYKKDIDFIQGKLRQQLDSVVNAKKEASRKYVMTPPSQDQLTLLSTLKLRGVKNIDDTEWQMYISTLAGNYQCSQILASMAEEAGKDFIPPVSSLNHVEQDIHLAEAYFKQAIDDLANPEDLSYRTMELLADRDNTPSAVLIEKLDREIISTVPSESLTTRNRLKDAAAHALHVGQIDLFNEIWAFISDNRDKLATPEENEAEFIAAAEKMIEAGNNATEPKITPYDRKLDKLSEDLKKATEGKENDQG